jgi:hypothetical protein
MNGNLCDACMTSAAKCMLQGVRCRIRAHTKYVKDIMLAVLNLTSAIGNDYPQIIFQVGVDRNENYAGGHHLPVSYF